MAALISSLAGYALAVATAELVAIGPRAALARWSAQDTAPEPGKWSEVASTMALARRLGRFEPDIAEDMGRIEQWRAAGRPPWDSEALIAARRALDAYRSVSAMRPTWPYAWAGRAQAKFAVREFDGEFFRALEQAASLGPLEADVQITVARLGLATWYALPDTLRPVVMSSVRKGLQKIDSRRIRSAELGRLLTRQRALRAQYAPFL
jgi:hypothetical protein